MLENEWLYDRAWENGFKEGIQSGKKEAYFDATQFVSNNRFDIAGTAGMLESIDELAKHFRDLAYSFVSPQKTDFPHEELTNSRLFHHVRASHLQKILDRFLQDKDHDPDFPLFNCTEAEKEKQSILAFIEKKDLPKVTQIYLYASLDVIDFYVRKANEYMERHLRPPADKFLVDIDIDIFIEEITLEIQMARLTSLRIKDDQKS